MNGNTDTLSLIDTIWDFLHDGSAETVGMVYSLITGERTEYLGNDQFEIDASQGGDTALVRLNEEQAEYVEDLAQNNEVSFTDYAGHLFDKGLHAEQTEESYDLLEEPLSEEELDEDGRVDKVILLHLGEMVGEDLNEFLNLLSRRVIGSTLLMEVDYAVVEVAGPTSLHVRVTGFYPEDQ